MIDRDATNEPILNAHISRPNWCAMSEPLTILDLNDAEQNPDAFAAALGDSFARTGFAIIANHGVDDLLVERAWAKTRALFTLSDAEKQHYRAPDSGGARGYTPFGTEIAKGASHVDLKEFWHIGRELPAGHRYADVMPPNVWPEYPLGFRETFLALFAALDQCGARILSGVARYLGLSPDWFDTAIDDGNSVLRLLHYPPVAPDAPEVRAAAHEDINLITLLLGAEEAGLELLTRDGSWLQVQPPRGAIVVNVGDMLQRLTNHRLPSTTHRVVNPALDRRDASRYSMPFFLHLAPDFVIETLPRTIAADAPNRYPDPITANAYLTQRLVEIGLLKK